MKINFTVLFSAIIVAFHSHGQEFNPRLTPSIEAEAVKNNSEVSVNYSTGTPQISYPIATIGSGAHEMSFALAYNASGRKVDEVASNCGWGWSLQGGGQITRLIKGNPDEQVVCFNQSTNYNNDIGAQELTSWHWRNNRISNFLGPYVHNALTTPAGTLSHTTTMHFDYSSNFFQPDEYYFSFNGRSGMFVLDKNGLPTCIPYQDLKIEFQECLHWFEIEDENGWTFRFDCTEITEFGIKSGANFVVTQKAASAWYLTSVRDQNDQLIYTLTYDDEGTATSINASFQYEFYCPDSECESINRTYQVITFNRHLKKTLSSVKDEKTGEEVDFSYIESRADEPSLKSLDKVSFTSGDGQLLSEVNLNYDYFKNEAGESERLKLVDIELISDVGNSKKILTFEYDETLPVVSNTIFAGKDHWGFYNGKDNIVATTFSTAEGQNDVDPTQNQRGILKRIISSSGASTSFEYECNTYSESNLGIVQGSATSASGILQPNSVTRFAGGLRVRKIVYKDLLSVHPVEKTVRFSYQSFDDSNRSSGYLYSEPFHDAFYSNYMEYGFRTALFECDGNVEICRTYNLSKGSSSVIQPLLTANGAYLVYRNVTVSTDSEGKIEMEFSFEAPENVSERFNFQKPFKQWNSGNLLKVRNLNSSGELLTEEVNYYEQIIENPKEVYGHSSGLVGNRVLANTQNQCQQFSNVCGQDVSISYLHYKYVQELVVLSKKISTEYDQANSGLFSTTTEIYNYHDVRRDLIKEIISITPDPLKRVNVKRFKYIEDYSVIPSGDNMNNTLYRLKNIVSKGQSMPIETIELAGPTENDLKVYSGTITELMLNEENHYLVAANYDLVLEQPISEQQFVMSTFLDGNFKFDENYRRKEDDIIYDDEDRVICIKPKDDIPSTRIFNNQGRVIAEITNAFPDECSYDSFEVGEESTWSAQFFNIVNMQPINVNGLALTRSKTGVRSLILRNPIAKMVEPGNYILSLWSTSPNFQLSLSNVIQTPVIYQEGQDQGGWAYYEFKLWAESACELKILDPQGMLSTILIDELRIYPIDAQMNSVSFNLDGTIRNECDVNNYVSTILYDEWKRPEWKLDDRLRIFSKIKYYDRDINNFSERSWMSEAIVLEQDMVASDILSASLSDVRLRVTKQYYDGFGRDLQTLAVRQSGVSTKDLVSFKVFDGTGRELKNYLPFSSQHANYGDFIENPIERQSNFYQSAQNVAHTSYPFAESIFEDSPMNRILEQGDVGEDWQIGNGHTRRIRHHFNHSNEVLLWSESGDGCSAMNLGSLIYYPENSLSKKHIVDESGASFWEFTDANGRLICKRTFALLNGPEEAPYSSSFGSGRIGDEFTASPLSISPTLRRLDIYFIYDDFGNLIYEIPAIACLAMGSNQQFSSISGGTNYTIFDGYMKACKYDKYGNVIAKKKPGEGWSFYVYNKLGQVVLSKSPSQSVENNKWNFVKYDKLGRPIQTGIYSSNSTIEQLQTIASEWPIIAEDRTGNISNVYTNLSFPNTNLEIFTETYYDNYDFDINGYTYSFAGTLSLSQSKRTKGSVTGSRVKVLDETANYLVNVSYWDEYGRPAAQFSENIIGGFDKVTHVYDYAGALKETRRFFKRNSGASETLTMVNKFEYDHAGRPTITRQRINNDEEIILSRLVYNELGQIIKKHLHIAGAANVGMQIVDYRYNERGWLKKINNADLSNDGDNLESWDVFGQEIIYNDVENYYSNTMQTIAQFGGNISAVKWKTNVTGEDPNQMGGHSYVFRYDDLGQMTGAHYAASNDDFIDNYNAKLNFWDERVSYDANGNIKSMYRTRSPLDKFITQVQVSQNPIIIDALMYQYEEHSNKLAAIDDASNIGWISNFGPNPYPHFVDGNNSELDYKYDEEGRLIKDKNKNIEYTYNHLDLISKASYGGEEVNFIWDATGAKLAKQVGSNTTYYFGGIEYTNNSLTHVATFEGIARPANESATSADWHYDYYIQDHLGNVRAVISEENSELAAEKVTVELARRMLEDASFDNVTATEKDRPYMYPYDPEDPDNRKVSELSRLTGKIIGPAKVIAVKRGEKVDLSTKYWYTQEQGTPLTDLTEILAGTLFNLGMASAGIIPNGPEAGMALLNNVSGAQFGNLSNFLSNSFNNVDLSRPRAFIVYMSFDKNMMLDPRNSGKIQVTDANTLGQLSKQDIVFRTDGYFYVYVTNQSETHVNFDNLIIRRWKPQVRVTYDYYPFGLAWENPKLPGTEEGLHDHTYQDKEYQFGEFADGRGLELHDFHARMYDATTGRWLVPDPAEQFMNPYLAMGNSPMVSIDPDGRVAVAAIVVGPIIGAYIGGSIANDHMNPFLWDYQDANTWIGIGGGAVIGAFGGHAFAAAKGSALCIAGKSMKAATGKKMFGSTVGGTINTVSNYEGEDSFGWGTLGDFAAGFVGSYIGLKYESARIGFIAGGALNVGNEYAQNDWDLSWYEAGQAFIGGGLSSMGGMSYGGIKSKWLSVERKRTRMFNKMMHYGSQSIAYDFAYSKEKDFMNRPLYDRASMFIFSGIAGALASEGFSGKFNKTESFSSSGGLPSLRDKTRSLVIGSVFNSFGAYMGGRSKGSMEKYYNKRSQRNKCALILMKSFADALYYWK